MSLQKATTLLKQARLGPSMDGRLYLHLPAAKRSRIEERFPDTSDEEVSEKENISHELVDTGGVSNMSGHRQGQEENQENVPEVPEGTSGNPESPDGDQSQEDSDDDDDCLPSPKVSREKARYWAFTVWENQCTPEEFRRRYLRFTAQMQRRNIRGYRTDDINLVLSAVHQVRYNPHYSELTLGIGFKCLHRPHWHGFVVLKSKRLLIDVVGPEALECINWAKPVRKFQLQNMSPEEMRRRPLNYWAAFWWRYILSIDASNTVYIGKRNLLDEIFHKVMDSFDIVVPRKGSRESMLEKALKEYESGVPRTKVMRKYSTICRKIDEAM